MWSYLEERENKYKPKKNYENIVNKRKEKKLSEKLRK